MRPSCQQMTADPNGETMIAMRGHPVDSARSTYPAPSGSRYRWSGNRDRRSGKRGAHWRPARVGSALGLIWTLGCYGQAAAPEQASLEQVVIDSARVVEDLRYISSSELEGRATGTAGNARAREYIVQAFTEAGLLPFEGGFAAPFTYDGQEGVNVVGHVRGAERPDRYLVVTAHYDHLGVRDGAIYHGADDNASGTAALLELARHFGAPENRPGHTIVFVAFDAEEAGLRGARAFVASPPVQRDSILLNVNMDMVSRNAAGEIYAAGTFHYPFLGPLADAVAERSKLTVLRGHDRPAVPGMDDWTGMSDHGAFHEVGIPFIYFGVEDHPDYHRPTDTFDNTDPGFFVDAVATVLDFIRTADGRLR